MNNAEEGCTWQSVESLVISHAQAAGSSDYFMSFSEFGNLPITTITIA